MIKFKKTKGYRVDAAVLGIKQEGGEVSMGEPGNMPAPQGDPVAMMIQAAEAGAQGDCDAATEACRLLLEIVDQGGQEEAPMAPEAPMSPEPGI